MSETNHRAGRDKLELATEALRNILVPEAPPDRLVALTLREIEMDRVPQQGALDLLDSAAEVPPRLVADRAACRPVPVDDCPSDFGKNDTGDVVARGWLKPLLRRCLLATPVGLLMAAAAAAAVWMFLPPAKHVAYIKLYMPIHPEGNVFQHPEAGADFPSFQRTQFGLLRSHIALDAVFRDPKVQQLDLRGVPKGVSPVEWLEREIRVEFPEGPELPRVVLSGDDPEQLKVLVTAIRDAYLKQVVEEQTATHRQERMDRLKNTQKRYKERLDGIKETNRRLAQAVGGNNDKIVELKQEISEKELAAAKKQLADVRGKLTQLKVDVRVAEAKLNAGTALQVSNKDIEARIDKDLANEMASLNQLRNLLAKEREKVADDEVPGIKRLRAAIDEKTAAIDAQRKALLPKYRDELQRKARNDAPSELALTKEQIKYYEQFAAALADETTKLTRLNDKLKIGALELDDSRVELQLAQNGYQKMVNEIDNLLVEMPAPPRVRKCEDATVMGADETARKMKIAGLCAIGAFGAVLLLASFLRFAWGRSRASRGWCILAALLVLVPAGARLIVWHREYRVEREWALVVAQMDVEVQAQQRADAEAQTREEAKPAERAKAEALAREKVNEALERELTQALNLAKAEDRERETAQALNLTGARNLERAMAQAGEALFKHEWQPDDPLCATGDGLGPVFNATSCVACHHQAGAGGSGGLEHNITSFTISDGKGITREGVVHAYGVCLRETLRDVHPGLPPISQPSLEQLASLATTRDRVAAQALRRGVNLSQRNTPALFGARLIDELPAEVIVNTALAQLQKRRESPGAAETVPVGRVARLSNNRIGRFGWKAQMASLSDFVKAACANELGLGNLGHRQPPPLSQPDYAERGLDLSNEQCDQITNFVASLTRPAERAPESKAERNAAATGKQVFSAIGCADCHTPHLGSIEGLYSDLLLHDMGRELTASGSYGGNSSPGNGPSPSEWRTPPLWGVADSAPYLHDGRAASLEEAIRLHSGQGAGAARLFARLPADQRAQLIAFLETLRAPAGPAITSIAGDSPRVVRLADNRSSDSISGSKLVLDGEPPRGSKKLGPTGTEVGMVAPDITGDDIDGKKLRLGDYRGKVVLLAFWGHWCGPCRAMYEKQRTLASDLAKKPFAVVGVNSDRDRDALKKVVADEKLPGRSFWNGGSTAGPISTAWQVRGWPTLVLIDAKGVIRKKWLGSPRADVLDKAIDDLIKEAEGH
jgi:CxxC motif-containing protein (DUF1111 family)/peroxiredoxin